MTSICDVVALTRRLIRKTHETVCLLFVALAVASFTGMVQASTLTPLHYFGASQDGTTPTGVMQASNGYFYAVTALGGLYGRGAVLVSPDGTNYSTLYSFSGVNGAQPQAALIQASNGYLYGTTQYGGTRGAGTVYGIGVDGSGFAVLHSFTGSDGLYPSGGLVQASNGYLYGAAPNGGANGYGTVFGISVGGTGFAVLHSFNSTDGSYPNSLIQATNGTLYGTTSGGGSSGGGIVFGILTSGAGFTTLHSFVVGSDGSTPEVGVVQASNGLLYGTTAYNNLFQK